jgi:WD40 repeat protein
MRESLPAVPEANPTLTICSTANVDSQRKPPITSQSPFRGHSGEVLSVAFSPNGKHAASGSVDQTIRLFSQAYSSDGFTDQSVIDPDGWIVGEDSHLLFWVPEQICGGQPMWLSLGDTLLESILAGLFILLHS